MRARGIERFDPTPAPRQEGGRAAAILVGVLCATVLIGAGVVWYAMRPPST